MVEIIGVGGSSLNLFQRILGVHNFAYLTTDYRL